MEDQTAPPWKLNTATITENHKLGYTAVNWLTCLRHKAPALYDWRRCICETMLRGVRNIHFTANTVYSCLPVVKKFSRPWLTCSSILALVRKVHWPRKPVMKRFYPQQWTGAVKFSWLSHAAPRTRVDCYVTRLASYTFIVVLKAENCEHIKTNRSKQTFEESPSTCDLMV